MVQHDDFPAEAVPLALDLFITPSYLPDVADTSREFDNMTAAGLDFAALDMGESRSNW